MAKLNNTILMYTTIIVLIFLTYDCNLLMWYEPN